MKTLKQTGFFLLIFLCINIFLAYEESYNLLAEEKRPVFSTWEGIEVDKCASIWLIRRFIAKNAVIKFFPKGKIIKEGIPFDMPDAKFRRYHNMSTFESLLKHYGLQDPRLAYIGKIIHDIEVNIWERKIFSETLQIQDAVNSIISNSMNNDDVIERSSQYFDLLYNGDVMKNGRSILEHPGITH